MNTREAISLALALVAGLWLGGALAVAGPGDAAGQSGDDARQARDERDDRGERGERWRGRGEGGGWRDGRDDEADREIDEDQAQAILEILRARFPGWASRLEALRTSDPAQYRQLLARFLPRMRHYVDERRHDPQRFRLRLDEWRLMGQIIETSRQVRAAENDAERQSASRELRALIEQQFDLRLKVREHELARLEQRLVELREQMAQMRSEKQALIDRQVEAFSSGRGDHDGRGGPRHRHGPGGGDHDGDGEAPGEGEG